MNVIDARGIFNEKKIKLKDTEDNEYRKCYDRKAAFIFA